MGLGEILSSVFSTTEFLGRNPAPSDLSVIFLTSGAAGGFLWMMNRRPFWQSLAEAVIAADIAGGVVANISKSTNDFYHKEGSFAGRMTFLGIHFLQPAFCVWQLELPINTAASLYAYQLAAGSLVLCAKDKPWQKTLATGLLSVGLLLCTQVLNEPKSLAWFGPLFLTKMVFCFAVDHH